jgi:hypothetical protein
MQRFLAAVLALTCVFASSASFARGGFAGGGVGRGAGGGGIANNPSVLFGAPTPPTAPMANPIPAPLPPPAQPPVINGPLSQPGFRGNPPSLVR